MADKFRPGTRVHYRTHKPPCSEGTGKIVAIHPSGRGVWYEIAPAPKKVAGFDTVESNVRVRLGGLALI